MTLADHLPILPVLLPALTAGLLLLVGDGDGRRALVRAIALGSVALGALLAVLLVEQAAGGTLAVYRLGNWPAPFGIVLVIDRLSAMLLLLTSAVALAALAYACGGWDTRGRYFHALFQFQLMGLNGAFATGDLFNLFVFFEVLLIASYVLLMHGLGRARSKAGMHYVVLNLVASALFLIGVSLLYAFTGTLNFADLAVRVPQLAGLDATLAMVAGWVLLVVFGFKAALAPLALWLPATYAAASAPVAALFAIMTKVGVYAILRVHGVIFGPDAGAASLLVQPVLLPLALAGGVVGVLGALAAGTLPRLVAWLTASSVGTILAAIGLFGAAAWSAALYYLLHSTLICAALFLLAELLARQRGDESRGALLQPGPAIAQPTLLGLMLLVAGMAMAGLPPLPGFVGKVMLLQAAAPHAAATAVWAVVLGVGFVSLLALARAGGVLFWQGRERVPAEAGLPSRTPPALLLPALGLMAASLALSLWAAPVQRYTAAAAQQVADRAAYAAAVLPETGGASAVTTRRYAFPQPAGPASAPPEASRP